MVYLGSCSGILFALDRRDGTPRWTHDVRPNRLPTSFHGDALLFDSTLVIGTDGGSADSSFGEIYAFGLESGRVVWKLSTRDGIVSDVIRAGDRLLAVTRADSLLCLDAASGRRLWSFHAGEPFFPVNYRSPAVRGDHVYFGAATGVVYALEAGSGRVVWRRDLGVGINTSLVALGDALYFGGGDGEVYRLRRDTGTVEAHLMIGDPALGHVATMDSLIVLATESTLVCVDPTLAAVRWRRGLPRPLSSSRPYLWRDAVLAATEDGELVSFGVSDGRPLWSHSFEGMIRGIGVSERTLYLGTYRGMVYAYRRGGGAWEAR
jgi:outer membrane protein assembly factor BamB